MKQGNYLQALNCTLRIKDCGRTWLGGKKGKIKIRLQEVHCNIHHADRPLNRALPAPARAALAAGAGGKQRQNGGELGWQTAAMGWPALGGVMGCRVLLGAMCGSQPHECRMGTLDLQDTDDLGFGPCTRMARERMGVLLSLHLCCGHHRTAGTTAVTNRPAGTRGG